MIKACALLQDIETLQYGDATEIGEKGVNLSGGQKSRVCLARAAYSKAKIVLLDDPLSAVDAPTARHLLNQCILTVFKGRTVILVSHAVNLVLPKSDYVVAIRNGSIFAQGIPADIVKNSAVHSLLEKDFNNEAGLDIGSNEDISNGKVNPQNALRPPEKLQEVKSVKQPNSDEGKAVGKVKLHSYKSYLLACGGFAFIFVVLCSFTIQVTADYLSNWWIQVWTDGINSSVTLYALTGEKMYGSMSSYYINPNLQSISYEQERDSLYYIVIFGLISFVELFALLFKYCIQFYGGIRASRIMHTKLSEAVFGSPMSFFERTPVGRIINRF